MKEAYIGNGTNKIRVGTNNTNNSSLYYGKSTFNSTTAGFYLGTDGFALGAYDSTSAVSPFQVTSAGVLTAVGANISGTLTATTGAIGG